MAENKRNAAHDLIGIFFLLLLRYRYHEHEMTLGGHFFIILNQFFFDIN